MSGGIQTSVANQPAPGVEGNRASVNPNLYSVLAGPGGLVAGPAGAIVGRFCWATPGFDGDGFPAEVTNSGSGPVTGFLANEQQGLNTVYLQDASLLVPQGFEVTLFSAGDFWVKNTGSGQALPGMKAYANFADGKITFAATGAPATGASSTGSIAANSTLSFTGSIANGVLTVTAVGSGTIVAGATLSGTGVASGTVVLSQIDGTAGGIGTYFVSIPEQSAASTTITGTYGVFTAGSTTGGSYGVGDVLTGTNVVAGTRITQLGTGTGGAGTYYVSNNTSVSSTTISVAATNVETKWICMSSALSGELCKISSQPLG